MKGLNTHIAKCLGSAYTTSEDDVIGVTDSHIDKQIDEARNRLLDLTLRNRLINFKPSAKRTIQIQSEDLAEIYSLLVLEERALGFQSRPQENSMDEITHTNAGVVERDRDEHSTSKTRNTSTSGRRSLKTDLSEDVLPGQLFRMSHEASSVLEEQGYTVLYLALGFLEWLESPSSEMSRLAPLVLLPVELTRTKVREAYRIKWTGEDIGTNLSLQERLAEAGVALPDFEMPEDSGSLCEYFNLISESIAEKSRWAVKKEVYLSFFSFTKFVMYKDLDPAGWPEGNGPSSHPLIRALFSPGKSTQSSGLFPETEIDDRLDWSSVYHVLDADPSQIAAIEDAKVGRNIVVEGPPGTGKSQTIANMVSELLAQGKTVLFVSEKMAALEVVNRRLDEVGLGEFCLELHSRKSRKRDVLAELERCWTMQGTQSQSDSAFHRNGLVEHIKKLNHYARDLRTSFGTLQLSPYQLYNMREEAIFHFSKTGLEAPRLMLDESEWNHDQLSRVYQQLHALADLLSELGPLSDHPWRGCSPELMLPDEVDELVSRVKTAIDAVQQLRKAGRELSAQIGSLPPSSLQAVKSQRDCLDLLQNSPHLPATTVLSDEWEDEATIKSALDLVEKTQQLRHQLDTRFTDEAMTTDAQDILDRMKEARSGSIPVLARSYRQWKRSIASLYKKRPSLFHRNYEIELTNLAEYQHIVAELGNYDLICCRLFGHLWKAEYSDLGKLNEALDWSKEYRKLLAEGSCTEALGYKAEKERSYHGELDLRLQDLKQLANDVGARVRTLFAELHFDPEAVLGASCSSAKLDSLVHLLQRWQKNSHKLPQWIHYQNLKGSAELSPIRELVEALEDRRIEKEDIEACLNLQVSENELTRVFAQRRSLREFEGTLHESAIEKFRQLDSEMMIVSQAEVRQMLKAQVPQFFGGAPRDSEAGILSREMNKKKRHMPIRKLMEQAGGLVQKIKPCFMMSPLSIAQFLDPRSRASFDVIIFDEASQVRPEDAIGALLRGKQLIVMGDTRQLPPTSFFDRLVEDTDDNEDEQYADHLGDIESILHLCRRSFPSRMLKWHYRSRHESLIAVSNQEFYDNSLIVYPSPVQRAENFGLRFVHLPDTVYDRGRTSENRREAIAVARAAIQHYNTRPNLSLGVGVFSTKQQNAILEEVQREIEVHPEVERHFSSDCREHFFVKNLETIQGDERDVIFLSVGYGFDRFGKLSRNFGPLNHDGGERRLNVLITRARSQCVVFSNFRAEDLRIDGQAPRGLGALKTFMQFAETGELAESRKEARDSDSPFEDAVSAFLRSEGFEIEQQVGCAGYRIDMAVAEPREPGRFVLGIECDGAKYHSSTVARERDRLRQLILERLGWRIYRVWSTDWYTQRKVAEDRLLRAVQNAMSTHSSRAKFRSGYDDSQRSRVHTLRSPTSATKQEPTKHNTVVENVSSELPTEPYVKCESLWISMRNAIHETPRIHLAQAVSEIVAVEAPIHVNEVIRRIRALWGLKRSGQRIRESVKRGIRLACSTSEYAVRQEGDFLWKEGQDACSPRYRYEKELLKIELISDKEIGSAVVRTLELQYSSPRDAIFPTAARLLGFQQTSEQIRSRMERVITEIVEQGRITEKTNGNLDLTDHG